MVDAAKFQHFTADTIVSKKTFDDEHKVISSKKWKICRASSL